jgi:hypothetical protein
VSNRELEGGRAAFGVVLGPGPRLAEIETLARAASAQVNSGLAVAFERIADLAELLAPRGSRGRLVLDLDHLPLEDLGFVRRFLSTARGWSLLLVGEDAGHRAARAALALERTRFLPWPPDIAQLMELAAAPADLRPQPRPQAAPASGAPSQAGPLAAHLSELADLAERAQLSVAGVGGAESEAPPELARVTRLARALSFAAAPPVLSRAELELGPVVEDLLAALTLRGKKAPRFLYRGARGIRVRAARGPLASALESALLLARSCAGAGEIVRVQLGFSEEARAAEISVEFPAGPLAGADPTEPLSGAAGIALAEVGPGDFAAARAVVRGLGGSLDLAFPEAALAKLRIALPAEAAPAGAELEAEQPAEERTAV